jgi:hypothetical protein
MEQKTARTKQWDIESPKVRAKLVREDKDGYRLEYIEMEVCTRKHIVTPGQQILSADRFKSI